MKRDDVVPYYIQLIQRTSTVGGDHVVRINNLILEKWSMNALEYIKNAAWKVVDPSLFRTYKKK